MSPRPTVSLQSLRDVVAGKSDAMSRGQAMALLCASDYPDAHHDLAAVLANSDELLAPRLLAVAQLGRIESAAATGILTAHANVREDEIRAAIFAALGRVGTRETLEHLTRAASDERGLVRSAARFAQTLLAHRFGVPGFELALPPKHDYAEPPDGAGLPFSLVRANESIVEHCLRCLAHRPMGIELAERFAFEVQLLRARRLVVFDTSLTGLDALPRLLSKPAFLGVVAAPHPETGFYYPRSLLLTSPGASARTLHLFLCRPRGQLIAAGSATAEPERIGFWLAAVARAGARPMRVEGVFDEHGASFTRAFAAPARQGKIRVQSWPPQ